jgi:outer membrane lipoprotein-sorting protein
MRYDLVDSLNTWMNVKVETEGQKEELRAYFHFEKPDKLRVDAMGIFNEPKAIITAVEESFRIYFVAENELIEGELSDDVVKEIFGVDIRVSDIRSSIFANPFLNSDKDELILESRGGEYVIHEISERADHREEVTISPKDMVVKKWRTLSASGDVTQEIKFFQYREIGGIIRPLKATIYRPADDTLISVESVDPKINVEIPENTFTFSAPESAKVYQISDLKKNQSNDLDAEDLNFPIEP